MRIAAALAWFDEPVEFLERCVSSLAGVVDVLVSADGAWQLFPDGANTSEPSQVAALDTAVAAARLEHVTLKPRLWDSQVEKRSALYGAAAELCDWVFVIDGDEWVRSADRLHEQLAAVTRDVCHASMSHQGQEAKLRHRRRRIFRPTPGPYSAAGLWVNETHNGVCDGLGRWLAGPRRIRPEPAADLSRELWLGHAFRARGERRDANTRRYYEVRRRLRVEVH